MLARDFEKNASTPNNGNFLWNGTSENTKVIVYVNE